MVEPYESRRQKKPTGAVRPNALPSPVDPFSVTLTPQNFNEVWGARKAQVAGSMPALAPRSPVQMPAMPANPSPLGTYANPDRGGYRFGFPQRAATPAPMPSPVRAAQQQAATLAQSFDRLRERSQAAPFGTYLAGTPETIGNLTEDRDWIDPAKTVTEQMTWPEYVMKNRAQMAAMQQGRPFDLTPAWIGPSGRQRPPSTWELAKQKSSTTGEGTVAEAIRSRAAERKLKEEPRRAMVTAKAQGRRISPVQAGIESTMAGGQQLSDDQNRMLYGPALDEIKARQQAATIAAISGMLTPGEGMPQDPNVLRSVLQMLPGFMQGGGTSPPPVPWSPLDPVEAETLATESPDARTFEQRLISMGVNPDEANMETRRRFPTRIGPWQSAISEAWETAPLVGMGMTSLAESNAPQQVAQISQKALKGLQQKAKAGDPEAQRILREGGYSW